MQSVIPQLTKTEQDALIRSLAPVRFRRFRAATSGDREAASLYLLDSMVASHMHATVRVIEVALREHLHRALSEAFGEKWYLTQNSTFDEALAANVKDALESVGENAPAGRVIAKFTFGTWVSLLGKGSKKSDGTNARYVENLWEPALQAAFDKGSITRSGLRRIAMSLNWARNRISHCEPVVFGFPQPGLGKPGLQIRRAPHLVLEDARTLASHISPGLEGWLRRWTEVDELLRDPLLQVALKHVDEEDGVELEQ